MSTLYNPALSEEPRNQSIKIIPPVLRESLLNWLERIGRFRSEEIGEFQDYKMPEELDDILETIEKEIYDIEDEEE
jgi:predicted house-cleaning noncanonical NTP pyrophosphatase (MazG superfamily)